MKDFGFTIVTLLCVFGLCSLLGFLIRKTETGDDADKPMNVILRGLGYFILIFGAILAVSVAVFILTIPFR